jgi:3-methyl-2-oxobutanoate hydroxymethyltransferase
MISFSKCNLLRSVQSLRSIHQHAFNSSATSHHQSMFSPACKISSQSIINTNKYNVIDFQSSRLMLRCFSTNVAPPLRSKVTSIDLRKLKESKKKITLVTAYNFPSAIHVDSAGIDVILVGDSVAMVELGQDTTLSMDMESMLYHAKAVAKGAKRALLVGDMPFGSYEYSDEAAYTNAIRFLKEGGMDCVKLEGGKIRAKTVEKLVQGGVAVMGHIGLTPQSYSVVGGFRAQGRSTQRAFELIEDAISLERAGACALVVECVPAEVGQAITSAVSIPTIGIGSGQFMDGQVLVYHDLLGMVEHEQYKVAAPRFCKRYATLGTYIHNALKQYRDEVQNGEFPGTAFSPYKMLPEESEKFQEKLKEMKEKQLKQHEDISVGKSSSTSSKTTTTTASDAETIKLY